MLRTTRSGRGVGPGTRSWLWKVMRLVRLRRVRKKSDRTRALQRCRERSLVTGASAGDTAREDLAAVADESPQARDLLVVDVVDFLDAEAADLAVLALRPPACAADAAAVFTWWTVDCHQ